MKKLLIIVFVGLLVYQTKAQTNYQDTTKYYSFEINYWFNLHHFLWLESFMNVNADSTIIKQKLSNKSQKKLNEAIGYYQDNLADLDLRTSDYMTEFKHWVTKQDTEPETVPNKFKEHMDILRNVSIEYKTHFWPSHKAICVNTLKDNIDLIRQTEDQFVDKITKLTRQFEKLRVDITYVGKATKRNPRNLPYTSIFPTHVVMNAIGENSVAGNWIELLYHESAHHLILGSSYFIGGTIKDLTETTNTKAPRQLGHSFLFYFTGQLTKQLLNEVGIQYDSTYMERNNVFSRYFPALDKHLKSYMNREITLTEATRKIIADLDQ
ncbi:MAG: hypothetical protein JXR03_06205 [Cyclobacteriaceae bacterium]